MNNKSGFKINLAKLIACSCLIAANTVSAQVISWHWNGSRTSGSTAFGTIPAGGFAGLPGVESVSHWNQSIDSLANLVDSAGAATGAGITIQNKSFYAIQNFLPAQDADGSYNKVMLNTYSDNSNNNYTLTNIPYASYTIYLYFSRDASSTGNVSIGTTTNYFTTMGASENSGTSAAFVQTTSPVSSASPNADYAIFTGLSGPTQVIHYANATSGGIAGIQVVNTGAPILPAPVDTWQGNSGASWNTAANWLANSTGHAPPANFDSVIFGLAGSSGSTLNNNISSLTLNSWTINSGASAFTFTGNTVAVTNTLNDSAAANQTIGLAIGGAGGVTVSGGGKLTLTANNTYTGLTTVNNSSLDIGGGTAAGSISSSSALSLGGVFGGTVSYTTAGGPGQTFNGVNLAGGGWVVNSGANTMALNALSKTAGSGADIKFPATGSFTTTTVDTNGMIGGWAVIDNGDGTYSWAHSGASGVNNITAATAITPTLGTLVNWAPASASSVTVSTNINSLIIGSGDDITISGGVILTNGSGPSGGGIIFAGSASDTLGLGGTGTLFSGLTGGELNVYCPSPSGTLIIGAPFANNGATTGKLVKDGPGSVILTTTNNSYTGGTFIYGGSLTLNLFTNASVGPNISLANGATLVFSNNGTGSPFGLSGGAVQGSGNLIVTAPAGTPAMGLAIIRMSSPQTVALTPGSLIDIEYGALRNDNGNSAWNNNYASAYINTNGMMDAWDGYMQVDSLNGYGTISHGWGPSSATFALGANGGSGSFFGIISNNFAMVGGIYGGSTNTGGSLNILKLGAGAETLYGTNYYQGNTTISNGILTIGGAGALWSQQSQLTALSTTYPGAINPVAATSIFNYASSQNLILSGGGSGAGLLELSGAGTLTLAGGTYACTVTNTTGSALWIIGSNVTTTVSGNLYFSAVTVSNAATLALYGTQSQAKNVTVNDGGGLTVNFAGAAQWSPTSLTLGNSTGASLNFAGLTNAGTASAPLNGSSLTPHGTVTVNINSYNDPNLAAGSVYPLLANSGPLANYTLGTQPATWVGHLAVNANTLDFVVDRQAGVKAATGTELTSAASWFDGSVPTTIAVWNSLVPSLGAGLTLNGGNLAWNSILVSGAASDIGITGTGILTNGNITLSGVNLGFGISNVVSGNAIWNIAGGETLTATNSVGGSGTLTVAGGGTAVFDSAGRTGTTIVSNATAIFNSVIAGSSYTLYNGATLVFSNSAQNLAPSGGTFSGGGTLLFTAPPGTTGIGTTIFRMNNVETVALNAGSLIDVEYGALRNDNGNSAWSGNFASAFVNSNGVMDAWDGYMQVDALNGYGVISKGWSTTATFAMGAANGNGAFYGIISNNFNGGAYGGAAGGTLNITKLGSGTQILYGTNTYVGNTVIYGGTFQIGGAGMMLAAANNTTTPGNYAGTINLVSPASIYNYASSQSETNTGPVIGAGQLVVSGAGTLTLTGANTYTGSTTISGAGSLVLSPSGASTLGGNINGTSTGILELAGSGATTISGNLNANTVVINGGTLALISTQAGIGGVTLNDGCKLTIAVLGASQWAPASLMLGNVTLNFNGVTNAGTTTAPIKPTALTRTGNVTVNVNSTADLNIATGNSYPLLAGVTSTNGYSLGAQPLGWIGQLAVSGNTLVYTTTLQYDIWSNASGNNLWDIGVSTNWVGNGLLNVPHGSYKQGDNVLFVDSTVTSNQVVTLSGVITPTTFLIDTITRGLIINSTTGNDISGSIGLTMIGSNTVSLLGGANTYSGVTTVNSGTVAIGAFGSNNVPSDVGQPNTTSPAQLVLNGGTLAYGGPSASTDRGITAGGGALGVTNAASTLTLNGLIAGSGMFTTTGRGTMIIANPANTYSGGTTIGGGTLQLVDPSALGSGLTNNNYATLNLNGLSLNGNSTMMMGTNVFLVNSNSTGSPVVETAHFLETSGNGFTLLGNGDMELDWVDGPGFPNWFITNNYAGTINLAGTNGQSGLTYVNNTGTTLLTKAGCLSALSVYGGLVKIISTSGSIMYSGNNIELDGGTVDMNGQSQLAGALYSASALKGGGVLTNSGSTLSTLILSGGAVYTNTIIEGPTGQISIVKTNGGTQTIGGTNKFTGGLALVGTAGTLNYGRGETNSPIFNYPVAIGIGTLNFNVSGTYAWNESTISGTAGTFGMSNPNMVMWLTNDANYQFGGNITVNSGALHLVATYLGSGVPEMSGNVTVANTTNATLVVDLENDNNPAIGGSLSCGATSTEILIYDNSGSFLQVGGGITANGATLSINVTGSPFSVPNGQQSATYTLMTATNCTGTFNPTPNFIGGAGLASPSLGAYVTTSPSGTVSLTVYKAYVWYGGNSPNNNWSYILNWSQTPNTAGELATLGLESSYTPITLDIGETIGGVLFNNTNSFGVVGSQTLTLNNNGNVASLTASGGTTNLIAVPVVLADSSGALGVNINAGAGITVSGNISGNADLTMNGGGTLTLSGANNTFTLGGTNNGVIINGGTVKLGNPTVLGPSTNVVVNNGGTLDLNGQTPTNVIVLNNGATLANNNSASTSVVFQPITQTSGTVVYIRGSGNITITNWSSGNAFNVTNYNTGTLDLVGPNDNVFCIVHTFSGTILLDKVNGVNTHAIDQLDEEGGLVKIASASFFPLYWGVSQTINGGTFDMNGQSMGASGLIGSASAGVLLNNATNTISTVTNMAAGTYNGTIRDGLGQVAVVSTAAWTLGGTNLFSGGLTVSAGTTTVSLGLLNTNLPVTVASGAVLSLGFSATNQIASLSLGGVTKPNGIYNSANSGGYITGTGALQVGPTPTGPTSPAVLVSSVTGNTLNLSWPSGLGWRLVSQTNSLATGLNPSNAAWGTVPGVSDGSAAITITRTNPAVFYKLVYP